MMKCNSKIIALAVLASFSYCRGETYEVSTVTEFTNAVDKATWWDTIVLAAGKTFDFSTLEKYTGSNWGTMGAPDKDSNGKSCVWFNKALYIVGGDTSHWSEKTSEQETIVSGGGVARIFYGYGGGGRNVYYSHLTFTNGVAESGKNGGALFAALPTAKGGATNCVFRSCSADIGGGTYDYTTWDCLYENCTAGTRGGGAYIDGSSSSGVNRFSGNVVRSCSAEEGGGVYVSDLSEKTATSSSGGDFSKGFVSDCVITNCSSTASDTGSGGGLYSANESNVVQRCRFECNVSGAGNDLERGGGAMYGGIATNCVFSSNCSTNFGGACAYVTAYGCGFTNNYSVSNRGGALSNCSAFNCDFYDNYVGTSGARGGACTHSDCVGCTFSGSGDVSGGAFLNCVFDGVTSHNGYQSYVFGTMRNKGVPLAVTNCLVRGCNVKYILQADGLDAEFVNCTFADNTLDGDDGCVFKTQKYTTYAATNAVVNCLFSGNNRGEYSADLTITNQTSVGCATFLTNCLYENGYSAAGDGDGDGVVAVDVIQGRAKFAGTYTGMYAEVPYYTPIHSSGAYDAGKNMDWMSTSTDLAGNARLHGLAVDIGCYESYIPAVGMIIICR